MAGRLCILGCRNFHREVAAVIAATGWTDVSAAAFPARCGRPPVTWEELGGLIPPDCTQVIVMGRACLAGLGDPPAGLPPLRLLPLEQCFHMVAGATLVGEAIAEGGYLITPAWLEEWPAHLAELGFTPNTAGGFFQDFARELVLLDTGIDPQARERLAELSDTLGLPARRVPVGGDHTRLLLAEMVAQWRLEEERRCAHERDRQHARERADQVSAMDLLARLAQARTEAEAVEIIEETFQMLFAPGAFHYLRVENGVPVAVRPVPQEIETALGGFDEPWAWTPSGEGFLLRIDHGDQVLGRVAVDRLAFPQHRERYLNLALAISGVCGLAIANARARKRLVETEKMASLGVLVGGVAHEINTPVGVGLTAASSLQDSTRRIAASFAARTMTQSDLRSYLGQAEIATELLRTNLERIAGLVDAFRQVAVMGEALLRRRFRLRDTLDEALRSLGDRFPADRVALHMDCDEALEVVSYSGDWATILVNLITNSLRHGFRGRERGRIDIACRLEGQTLVLDYRDDGNGVAPEALARIFDPFFTTDLQHGMGLGLHLVYNLVNHRLGGAISCASTPGAGVHFHLEAPAGGE